MYEYMIYVYVLCNTYHIYVYIPIYIYILACTSWQTTIKFEINKFD